MKIGPIVLKLRLANTHFKNNIGGVVDLQTALNYSINNDTAFVFPLNDDAGDNSEDNSVNQLITERFAVLVVLKSDLTSKDKLGLGTYDLIHDIKTDICYELVGLDLGYESPIRYSGSRVIDFNSAYLWYQFDFELDVRLVLNKDGFGIFQTRVVDDRTQWSNLDDFNNMITQYVLDPSLNWDEIQDRMIGEGNHLPQESALMIAEQYLDLSRPYTGGFDSKAFVWGFDRYRVNK